MKKILSLLTIIGLVSSTTSAVVSCRVFEGNDGNGSNTAEKPEEKPTKVKVIKEGDKESWDYQYNSIKEYEDSIDYHFKDAKNSYSYIQGFIDKGEESVIWNALNSVIYFETCVWQSNEMQWYKVRIDEINGNYKYNQIEVNSLTQNSYSKQWFQERNKILSSFIKYHLGGADEIIQEKYGIYGGGFKAGIDKFKNAMYAEVEAGGILGQGAKETINNFIDPLNEIWKQRFDKIKKLSEKINEILVNWNE